MMDSGHAQSADMAREPMLSDDAHHSELLDIVRRLETLVASLRGEVAPRKLSELASVDKVRATFGFRREVYAHLVSILLEHGGGVVSDDMLCRHLRCSPSSLTVFASHTRSALAKAGYPPSVTRVRQRGYYIPYADAEKLKSAYRLFAPHGA